MSDASKTTDASEQPSPVEPKPSPSGRMVSLDQFRGYTVAGMLLVNYLGGYKAIHEVFKHNNTYLSYADTIMPSFMFVVGYSYRLTALKREQKLGKGSMVRHAIVRSLLLVLLSVLLFGFNQEFKSWDKMSWSGIRDFVASLFKSNLWEVLAIIGVSQLVILPLITTGVKTRLAAFLGFGILHVILSHFFNFDFVYGRPNGLDPYWGVADSHPWDGGFFGILSWGAIMLAGTLAYDVAGTRPTGKTIAGLVAIGLVLMSVGYGLSCLTRLYDVKQEDRKADAKLAESPVWPPFEKMKDRPWSDLLAEPPFVAPPPTSERPLNYWMMGKKVVSLSFVLFASGYAFALLGLFSLACDVFKLWVPLFDLFGRNALAAYIIHHKVEETMHQVAPEDSPLWWCLGSLVIFYLLSYMFVRFWDRHQGLTQSGRG